MKKINFAVSIGSNVTSIYKSNVGVVLNDKSVLVTDIKGKREVAISVGADSIASGVDYRHVINDGEMDFSLAELMLGEYFKKCEISKRDGVLFLVSMEDMKYKSEFRNLAYGLGVNNVEVIPSIVATAYGYEIENFKKAFLLVDIGVNTEIAIIANGRIITGATVFNGGNYIDKKIAKYILENKGIELSKETCEKVKNEIATLLPNDERSIEIQGFIKGSSEYSMTTVTSNEIFGLVVEEYSAITTAILQVLSSVSSEINEEIKKHGVYLCGASSKITGIEKFIKTKLNLESFKYKPDAVTMIGAGQILDNPLAIEKVVCENM